MINRWLSFSVLATAVALASAPAVAAAEIKACKSGVIVAGNPKYSGLERPAPTGAPLKSDPSLALRTVAFVGNVAYTSNGQEIWAMDLGAGTLRRVAGEHQRGVQKLSDGPCAKARFNNVHGIAALPDGSLVVADFATSALLKVQSPADPATCAVAYLAGTSKPTDGNVDEKAAVDGPGAQAKLMWPEWPVADAAGNVYFIDSVGGKLRKLASDAAHTVSTVATLPSANGVGGYRGLTVLKDKLYTVANSSTEGLVFEIDPTTGAVRKVFQGGFKQMPEIRQNTSPSLAAITSDGTNLMISGSGYIWKLTPSGKLSYLAGNGSPTDFPKGYDLAVAHPVKELFLRFRVGDQSVTGSMAFLVAKDGALYYRGREDGSYLLKIDCK